MARPQVKRQIEQDAIETEPMTAAQVTRFSQSEIDRYWSQLSAGGDEKAQQCGWLKDRFGLSWQIVPAVLPALVSDPDKAKAGRVIKAIMKMKNANRPARPKSCPRSPRSTPGTC